jgi:hypothetical protein
MWLAYVQNNRQAGAYLRCDNNITPLELAMFGDNTQVARKRYPCCPVSLDADIEIIFEIVSQMTPPASTYTEAIHGM